VNIHNKLKIFLINVILFFPLIASADVLVDVTATMVAPACNIHSENTNTPLLIDFGTLNVELLEQSPPTKQFSLYITDCDLTKTFATVLEPKNMNTIIYEGRYILGTSTAGLGIDFNEVTNGIDNLLEFHKKMQIYPEKLNETTSKIDLQTKLVSIVPIDMLTLGEYTSSMIISIIYY
jgi:type 1 fimbria pilin